MSQRGLEQNVAVDTNRGLFSAIVSVAAGLELNSTLRRIVTNAVELVDASYGALGVLDEDGIVQEFIHVGIPADEAERIGDLPQGDGILGLLIDHPVPIRLPDLRQHSASIGFPNNHPVMTTFLGVPVRVRGEVFGNLYLTEKRNGQYFTAEDERTVMALAAAAAVAIENARLFGLAQQRELWQTAVSAIGTSVLSGKDSGETLNLIAEKSRILTQATAAIIALPDSQQTLSIEILNRETNPEQSTEALRNWLGKPAPAQSILERSFNLGASVIEEECGLWNDFVADQVAGPAVALPLRTADRVLGVLLLLWPQGSRMARREVIELVESFAAQAALTLVLSDAQRDKEHLALLEDRDRIGRDLHDLVIQRVFAAGMMLQGVTQSADAGPKSIAQVEKAMDQLDETIREIRQTVFDLHLDINQSSLIHLVEQEVQSASVALRFAPTLKLLGLSEVVVPNNVSENLLAVVRESLTNCAKHARATEVSVLVSALNQTLTCSVTDNGVGYQPNGRSSGVANMERRAHENGGTFSIETQSGGGTAVTWTAAI